MRVAAGTTILPADGAGFTGAGGGLTGGGVSAVSAGWAEGAAGAGVGVALAGGRDTCNMICGCGSGRKISHPASKQTSAPPQPASSLRGRVQNGGFAGAVGGAGGGEMLNLRFRAPGAGPAPGGAQ